MTLQVRAGLRDAWRVRGRTAVFAVMVMIGTVLLSTGLSELATSLGNVRSADSLSRLGGTFFRVHYLTEEPFVAAPTLTDLLEAELSEGGSAFTTVRYNFGARDSFPYPVLVVLGDVETAFGLPPVPAGSAVLGSDVALYDIGDTLDLGATAAPVVGRLPDDASFLDPWQGRQSLENTVVLRLDLGDVAASGWAAHEEAVARTVFLDPPPAVVDAFVAGAWQSGLQLIPVPMGDGHGGTFGAHQRDSVLYTMMYAGFLALVVVAVGSTATAMARRSARSLAIQRLHGARVVDMVVRLATYLAVATIGPVMVILGLAALALPGLASVVPWAVTAVLAVYVLLVTRVAHVVTREDLAAQLGGRDQ